MQILAIDTSCDETAAAVTNDTQVLSNVIWSQASLHSKFGGVMPSLAQRQHQERIDYVVNRAMLNAKCQMLNIDVIAVTIGPGLGIALGVGINYAKKLAIKYNKPLIPINHIEGHLLSSFVIPKSSIISKAWPTMLVNHKSISFPALGLVLSGGTTMLCLIKNIGDYQVLAETGDDALGEALDKGARLLGLGYPGGAILEKFARSAGSGQARYKLPIPLIDDREKNRFSYSGLKTAFVRLFNSINNPTKQDIYDLSACFQEIAFEHILRVLEFQIENCKSKIENLLLGGGVANNVLLKSKLRKLLKNNNIKLLTPSTKKLNGDNAAMIGVTAYLKIKNQNLNLKDFFDYESIDRNPKLRI